MKNRVITGNYIQYPVLNYNRILKKKKNRAVMYHLGFCCLSHGAVSIAGLCSGVGTILLKQPFPTTPFKIYSKLWLTMWKLQYQFFPT